MKPFLELLAESAARHSHLCPRQVLGVRTGILAGQLLGLELPQVDKRLLAIVETDGCMTDGIAVATNCWVGSRTMRIEDYGKVAATFVDTDTGRAVRIVPRSGVRQRASEFAPEALDQSEAMLLSYQRMPAAELFSVQSVQLNTPVAQIISRPGTKGICRVCGEEIINEREVLCDGRVLCRPCAGQSYYSVLPPFALLVSEPISEWRALP